MEICFRNIFIVFLVANNLKLKFLIFMLKNLYK